MKSLFNLLTGGIVKSVDGLTKTIFGDAEFRERAAAKLKMKPQDQFAAEFRRLQQRTYFDALVDGLNRLPRPVMVFGILAYFTLAYVDPAEFQRVNVALEGVPEPAWYLLSAIVSFFFGARELHKQRTKNLTLNNAQFDEQQRRMAALAQPEPQMSDAQKRVQDVKAAPAISDADYEREMDSDDPMNNPAIARWNREHNHSYKGD